MLTEDAVIGSLCEYLVADGWEIVSRAMPDQRGTDVVATRDGVRLEVEAKGAGSSKPHTARYGQPFNQAQVRVHVGEAVLKALAVEAGARPAQRSRFPTAAARLCTTTALSGEDGDAVACYKRDRLSFLVAIAYLSLRPC